MMVSLIPRSQRVYIAEHPVVFWFSLGIALAGLVSLVAPQLSEQTASAQLLPDWLSKVFFASYTAGGLMSFIGISRGWRKLEAAGMALLSGGLLANFITYAYLVKINAASGIFLLALAIGCAQRSWHLATRPYLQVEP